ncbi:MAG: sigma-70 family RNA polymerase sigma factor [Oscillospiraceae bacterium]|nr:sigma-70 family RNA polymerase sigma factor [Oscillospiraceae bacterium]
MTDEELATRAAHGDDNAMAQLIARMEPLTKAKAARFPALHGTLCEEDLMQEGMLGFLKAVRSFQPEKGTFRAYAAVCIQNSILSAVRSQLTRASAPNRDALPLDENTVVRVPAHYPEPDTAALEATLAAGLTALESAVLAERLAGHKQSAIAAHLGISSKAADNALQRIRRKLKGFQLES